MRPNQNRQSWHLTLMFLLLGAFSVLTLSPASAQAALTKVDDSDAGWAWRNMFSYEDTDAYKGIAHGTHTRNGYGQYKFKGTSVELYGRIGPRGGVLEVLIDNVSRGRISVNGPTEIYNHKIFSINNLSDKTHTIKIVSKNSDWVMIDYLLVGAEEAPAPVPVPAPTVTPSPSPTPVTPPPAQDAQRFYDEREAVVRTLRNFANHQDVVRFVTLAKKYNFTTISVSVKQDEDDAEEAISGTVFYQSTIAPIAPIFKNFDVIADLIKEAKARGLKVKAWMPQFHDQVAARKNPDWAMKALVNGKIITYQGSNPNWPEHFANPLHPDVQAYQLSLIKEFLAKYQVDALAVDWLRFDDYHMDLSERTRSAFQAIYGYDPLTIDFSRSSTKRNQWNEFRSDQLAAYAKKVRDTVNSVRPGLSVGSYTLPPEFVECGQDSKKLSAHLDFFSPMAYFEDWGKPISWVWNNLIADTVNLVGNSKVIPTYSVFWTQSQYREINNNVSSKFPKIRSATFFKYTWWDEKDFQNAENGTKK